MIPSTHWASSMMWSNPLGFNIRTSARTSGFRPLTNVLSITCSKTSYRGDASTSNNRRNSRTEPSFRIAKNFSHTDPSWVNLKRSNKLALISPQVCIGRHLTSHCNHVALPSMLIAAASSFCLYRLVDHEISLNSENLDSGLSPSNIDISSC